MCCFQVSLESKWSPRYLTVDDCGITVLFMSTAGHSPFFIVKVTCIEYKHKYEINSLFLIFGRKVEGKVYLDLIN
jgi:hypothetical protein